MRDKPTALRGDASLPYCKGCGHGLVLRALGSALDRLGRPANELVIVTDIGCVGLADSLFATPHTVHTTHGRSPAFAAGIALADSVTGNGRLKPVVMIGDGGATIGISHLINAALLNTDLTVLIHNNFLFGMTGGQSSALSPEDFVTATTKGGNFLQPLDLADVLIASRASFVARKLAGDRDLSEVIAKAVETTGFAAVEIMEICTAYATRWNPLTGAKLREVSEKCGYRLGVLREEPRPTFGALYRERHGLDTPRREEASEAAAEPPQAEFSHSMRSPLGIILAGTAGERVQTAGRMLANAAMLCGLTATQKNDNPVTQGTGFSVSEVIIGPGEIHYTGIETPDVIVAVSPEGVKELIASGLLARAGATTQVLADADVELPEIPATVRRLPFRAKAGGRLAAAAAVGSWLEESAAFPVDAFWTVAVSGLGAETEKLRAAVGDCRS
jgi:pyruvate/2-oxoacid:ferredoxin oxidoreductase beta subunit